ncbi:hypothetical protein EFM14_13895 [Lactococcus lactis]|nr:hypothetical protein [Lactococcus lactis]
MINKYNLYLLLCFSGFLAYLSMYLNSKGSIFFYPVVALLILSVFLVIILYLSLKIKNFRDTVRYILFRIRGGDE